jgi:beta-glucosidase
MMSKLSLFALLTAGLASCLFTHSLSIEQLEAAPPKKLSSFDGRVREILKQMTLDEKIGQMTQADQSALKDIADIDRYFLGSLLSGGDSDPKAGNSLRDWAEMYDRYQSEALKTRLAIPLLYGVDAVHGHNNVIGAVVFPHNIGLGCTRNPALVEKAARVTAEEMLATGVNWTFAPCVAVPRDIRWGRTYEGFGEMPELAVSLGRAAVIGFQGDNLGNPFGVLACAKHYIGDGGTMWGTGAPKGPNSKERWPLDQGDTRLDEKTLRDVHLQGYIAAIKAGVGTIMPSYSSWDGEKCSGSRRLLTEILKNELGFEGFLISDYGALDQLPGSYPDQIEKSINAGMDMVMVPNRYREFFHTLKSLVQTGRVPMSRIDDAVTRILRVKVAMGLLDKSRPLLADKDLQRTFGSEEHRLVARECVRESAVLLKNDSRTLPISRQLKRIHVAGSAADDMGMQCGGWTITWQGKPGSVTTGGTTLLQAIRKAASRTTEVSYSRDGSGAEGADVGICVIGERPYAEVFGDSTDLSLSSEDQLAVANVKRAGIPAVVVLISGRPMIINQVLGQSDAFLAAWLPGTEGEGITDILFGDRKPTGKLSFSWPRSTSQLPARVGDPTYDPLFKYGFGLTY